MLGGRSDHTIQNFNTKVVDDGISMMHLNQMGDLVGEDTNRAARIVLSFTHSWFPTTYHPSAGLLVASTLVS